MKTARSRMLAAVPLILLCASLVLAAFPRSADAMSLPTAVQTQAPAAALDCAYSVVPGDNLFRIALRFGVSPFTLASANDIDDLSLIFAGTVLRVPCSAPQPSFNICNIHIVQPGEWLNLIAVRLGVSAQSIVLVNRLSNPNLVFPFERLLIPCASVTPMRVISISQPVSGQAVCTPVSVSGAVKVSPFEATLRGRVYNAQGAVVGENAVHVNAQPGSPGTFSGQISFDANRVLSGTQGRVELADISPRDGSVLGSSSVPITFSCGQ